MRDPFKVEAMRLQIAKALSAPNLRPSAHRRRKGKGSYSRKSGRASAA